MDRAKLIKRIDTLKRENRKLMEVAGDDRLIYHASIQIEMVIHRIEKNLNINLQNEYQHDKQKTNT